MPGADARPLVIGHRGASADAPENTIAAFELALDQGADGIELDVHLSADEQPVVIHDFTLERTTDGAGPVSDHRVRELKRLDAGGWHDRRFRGQRVQTLQEVLERFRDRARFWIELKGGSALYPGIEERVVSMVEIYDVVEPGPRAVLRSRGHRPGADAQPRDPGGGAGGAGAARPGPAGAGGGQRDLPRRGDPDRPTARGDPRARGSSCYVWTVNEPAQMDRLVEWSVDGIITDRPGLLRARLGRS